ncbi:hypothetical protein Zmor_018860 [Zophobas morio]|uniref:Peptidase S1 domain-containing protein n=1 Tax=Zophobas morio TaxID=2755281 RepID=A0AA38IB64_9CUCU|nr:hypothetical protein Zmor_018860 [Zophobas morio]
MKEAVFISAFLIFATYGNVLRSSVLTPQSLPKPRILNGQQATLGQFPWQVAILTINSLLNQTTFCGGALISEEWVLTSAHCIDGSVYSVVYSGTVDLNDPQRTLSLAETHIVHENFTVDFFSYEYDIGLIKLNEPLIFDETTKSISLAEEELEAGTEVTISGFGHTSGEDGNDTNTLLNYIVVPTMNTSECGRYLYEADTPGIICTFFNNGDDSVIYNPCIGDGGSPLVVDAGTNPVHVGSFSFLSSFGCDASYPAAHTRTASYREWIKEKTGV